MNKLDKNHQVDEVMRTLSRAWSCDAAAFASEENVFLPSETALWEVVSFGKAAVFRAQAQLLPWTREMFGGMASRWVMDTDNLYRIETMLRQHGARLCGEHMRYLYLSPSPLPEQPPGIRYVPVYGEAVLNLYEHRSFDNALGFHGRDVIALCAYDGDALVAMAAADDHLEPFWQIGIDTLPAYRGRGLAHFLVRALTDMILHQGRLPFYTTWGANLASTRVALACGFRPAWLGYFAERIPEDGETAT